MLTKQLATLYHDGMTNSNWAPFCWPMFSHFQAPTFVTHEGLDEVIDFFIRNRLGLYVESSPTLINFFFLILSFMNIRLNLLLLTHKRFFLILLLLSQTCSFYKIWVSYFI